MRVISIVAEKGGTGKTTNAVNIAAALAEMGKVILLIDMDAQANASANLGVTAKKGLSTAEMLMKECSMAEITTMARENLYLAPASRKLYKVQDLLPGERGGDRRLAKELKNVQGVDFVIIDNAPGSSKLTDNSYMCSTEIYIPVETMFFSAKGLNDIKATIADIKEDNPELKKTRIIITKVNHKRNQDRAYCDVIREQFGSDVFKTEIPETVRLSEAQGKSQSILEYKRWSSAGLAYKSLAEEIVAMEGAD